MIHPQIASYGSFAHLKLGRLKPVPRPKALKLAKYLDGSALGEIPDWLDIVDEVPRWPMYGNDTLGDCTVAAAGHMIQTWTSGNNVPSNEAILAAYWATGDQDDGRNEVEILNYWRKTGIAGKKILAYVSVDPTNLTHVRAATFLFGGVYIGVGLPITAQRQKVWEVVGDGKTGDSAPWSWGGHAVPYGAYGGGTFTIVTWGGLLDLTEAFHLAYVEEVYALISADWVSPIPGAFDLASLTADLKLLRAG